MRGDLVKNEPERLAQWATALSLLLSFSHTARLLLRAGANPRARDSRALADARKYADEAPEMAELIERYM